MNVVLLNAVVNGCLTDMKIMKQETWIKLVEVNMKLESKTIKNRGVVLVVLLVVLLNAALWCYSFHNYLLLYGVYLCYIYQLWGNLAVNQ